MENNTEKRLDALEKELSHIKNMILECAHALDPRYSENKRFSGMSQGARYPNYQIDPMREREAIEKANRYNQALAADFNRRNHHQFIHRDKLANG